MMRQLSGAPFRWSGHGYCEDMRVIVGSDDVGVLVDAVIDELQTAGHDVTVIGPVAGSDDEWAAVGRAVGRTVAGGQVDLGVVLCWTGTGVAIAANKVPGVRAALCLDAETSRLARRYNHANVLALSMRSTSAQIGREIVRTFVESPVGEDEFDRRNVGELEQ
jgi:ribose 5-phosphate isomerase B